MIIVIDIGNSSVALSGIRGEQVVFTGEVETNRQWGEAEYTAALRPLLEGVSCRGAILSSVVPPVTETVRRAAAALLGTEPMLVTDETQTGLVLDVPEKERVGKDRLVDAAYAAANFPLPVITVDLGTATTFNVVDENRVFRGGVICPGLSTGLRALGERCAQLPQVRLNSPKTAIGVNTESCMLSGSVLGTAVLLDGITQRIEEELGRPATLVVTGGLAKYVTPLCRHPLIYDPELLLKGLALLYQMNAPQPHYAAGGRRRNQNNNFRRGRRPRSQRRERREEEKKNG